MHMLAFYLTILRPAYTDIFYRNTLPNSMSISLNPMHISILYQAKLRPAYTVIYQSTLPKLSLNPKHISGLTILRPAYTYIYQNNLPNPTSIRAQPDIFARFVPNHIKVGLH